MLDIKIGLTDKSKHYIDKFPRDFRDALQPTFEKIMLKAEARSKEKYFLDGGGINSKLITSKSGNLRRSVTSDVKQQANKIFGYLISNMEYSSTHEFGDPSRNIKARPFLYPAINDIIEDDNFERFLINEIDKLTRWT